jgi:uncharacterized SAM-binding protein YcdF (DUF218 family)
LFVIATPLGTALLLRGLEDSPALERAQILAFPQDSLVVVLTGGKHAAAEYPEGETLSAASLERARYAARLSRLTGLRVAISGGSPRQSKPSEALLMKHFMESELQQKVAMVEEESRNTRESAQRFAELLAHERPAIVLVTHVIHMPRAARAFESTGFHVIKAPIDVKRQANGIVRLFMPSAQSLYESSAAIHELLGIAWYWLLDRLEESS